MKRTRGNYTFEKLDSVKCYISKPLNKLVTTGQYIPVETVEYSFFCVKNLFLKYCEYLSIAKSKHLKLFRLLRHSSEILIHSGPNIRTLPIFTKQTPKHYDKINFFQTQGPNQRKITEHFREPSIDYRCNQNSRSSSPTFGSL